MDKECVDMERQKEERKRMKEEREQKKEEQKRLEKQENQQRTHINKAFAKIPRFNGTNPSYCFDWLEQTEALVNEHQGRVYRENYYSTVALVYPRPSMHYLKEPQTSKLKMQYYKTISTLELFHNAPMHTSSYIRSLMKLCRHTTPDTHHTSILPTPNWKSTIHLAECTASTTHHLYMANLVMR